MGCYGRAECDPKGTGGRAESPQCARRRNPCPRWGLTRRLRRGRRACSPMGRSIVSRGEPKVSKGRAESPLVRPQAQSPAPVGLTRRLRRGLGLAVLWGAHTFLSVAKEKCAKESQRHGDSGKKPFIAHFDGGARYVARSGVGQITHAIVRARSSPFSAVKMGGPFSLRCLSPLCFPAVGGGQAHPLQGGMLRCILGIFAAAMNGLLFLFPDDGRQAHTLHGGLLRRNLGIFATPKASVKSNPRWP